MDLFPKAGTVSIDKYDSPTIKRRKIPYVRRKIGVIFQNYHLLEDRNLFENIALPLHVLGNFDLSMSNTFIPALAA